MAVEPTVEGSALEESPMSCPKCSARQLVEIGVNLSGKNVTLHSCSRCDSRWWDDEQGEVVQLDEVIDLATVRR
jgi:transposase-like protein